VRLCAASVFLVFFSEDFSLGRVIFLSEYHILSLPSTKHIKDDAHLLARYVLHAFVSLEA
jgi:hypothetical protein